MDLEELSTTQIILLVLLVSFVTSIATGIVTVTLLAQAPPAVTETINHVVERTVQTVVPNASGNPTVVKETTTVVKEDDLITDSIEKSAGKLVRIHAGTSTSTPVAGIAVVLDAKGTLATDSGAVFHTDWAYTAELPDGSTFPVAITKTDDAASVAFLTPNPKKGEAFALPALTPISFPKDSVKLGSTALALSGFSRTKVSSGIVTDKGEATAQTPALIYTSVSSDVVPGTPLINIFGEVVGLSTAASRAEASGAFVSSSAFSGAVLGTSTVATADPMPAAAAQGASSH